MQFCKGTKNLLCDTGIFCSTPCKMRGLLRLSQQALTASRAYSSSSTPERKVAILGAAGGIGQPLALLMNVDFSQHTWFCSFYTIFGMNGIQIHLPWGNDSNVSEPYTVAIFSSASPHID